MMTDRARLYEALCSGFTPETSAFVRDKLRVVVKRLTENVVRAFRIPVDKASTAFIVPDPTGTLAPNEIYVSPSNAVDPSTGEPVIHILGEVLALRSPCKLPTDVQKMRAVIRPELQYLKDVIVMSADAARCLRSPASMLGGGDYDGDTVQVIWEPEIVEPFRNASDKLAEQPEWFVKENFEKETVKVHEVLEKVEGEDEEVRIREMQKFLLGGLDGESLVGRCEALFFRS